LSAELADSSLSIQDQQVLSEEAAISGPVDTVDSDQSVLENSSVQDSQEIPIAVDQLQSSINSSSVPVEVNQVQIPINSGASNQSDVANNLLDPSTSQSVDVPLSNLQ
jgi:hypothetical protein